MGGLLTQMLMLAKSEHTVTTLESVELRELLETSIGLAGSGLRVELSGPSPVVVRVDRTQITQVFCNLIENVRFHAGSDRLSLSWRTHGGHLEVEVRDWGCGIEAMHLPHVCERFYRVDPSRHRLNGGAGLGLSIAAAILEAQGGSLTVQSEPRLGTCILVRLPSP